MEYPEVTSVQRPHLLPEPHAPCSKVDEITVDVEADVSDNQKLFKAIMANTMRMVGSISQQMAEFDGERRAADRRAGEGLSAAVEGLREGVVGTARQLEGRVLAAVQEISPAGMCRASQADEDSQLEVRRLLAALHESQGDLHVTQERLLRAVSGMAVPAVDLDQGDGLRAMEQRVHTLEQSAREPAASPGAASPAAQGSGATPWAAAMQAQSSELVDLLQRQSDRSATLLESHGTAQRDSHSSLTAAMSEQTQFMSSTVELMRGHIDKVAGVQRSIAEAVSDSGRQNCQALAEAVGRVMESHVASSQRFYGEFRDLLTSISRAHDRDEIAEAVHRRLGEGSAGGGGRPGVPDAVEREARMLDAIEAMQKASMAAILEAIGNIDLNVTVGGRKLANVDAVEASPGASQWRQQRSPRGGPRGASSSPLSPRSPLEVEASGAGRVRRQGSPSGGPRAASSPLSPQWPPLDGSSCSAGGTPPRPRHAAPDAGGGGGFTPSSRSTPEPAQAPARQEYSGYGAFRQQGHPELPAEMLSCRCGYTCGTESAMRKHLDRFRREPGHERAPPVAAEPEPSA